MRVRDRLPLGFSSQTNFAGRGGAGIVKRASPSGTAGQGAAQTGLTLFMSVKQLFDLSGRVAVITGGSVGLGRQMAGALAEMGANLVLCARKKERCQQAAEELQKLGVRIRALGCDVKNPANVQDVVDATVSEFGKIDILINNAGTSWGAPVEEMRLEHWNKVIETNLTGTFLFSQAVGKVLIAQKRGKIINIAS